MFSFRLSCRTQSLSNGCKMALTHQQQPCFRYGASLLGRGLSHLCQCHTFHTDWNSVPKYQLIIRNSWFSRRRQEAVIMLYRKQCQKSWLAACLEKKAERELEMLHGFIHLKKKKKRSLCSIIILGCWHWAGLVERLISILNLYLRVRVVLGFPSLGNNIQF